MTGHVRPTDQEPEAPAVPEALSPTRRRVLGVAAAAGAAGLLAACGGGGSDSSQPAGSSSGDPSTSSGSSSGAGQALAKTGDVPVGGGKILDAQKIVVTQPQEGQFKAFSAICTHQSCTVASVESDVIMCPCHGSEFSAADGSVKNGPATTALREIQVAVQGDSVVQA
jgi:Rieske Fe-S protein